MVLPQPKIRYDGPPPRGPSESNFRRLRLWPVTYWLMLINIAVFLAQLISDNRITARLDFSIDRALYHYELWRFLTFAFLHGDFWHIIFNMMALYYFGPRVETHLGGRRFVGFYLICSISGALGYLLIWRLGFLRADVSQGLIGASAGVFGVLVAVVYIAPHTMVQLLLPPVMLRIRTIAMIFIGLAVVTILAKGENAGGEAAHLGGALAGWILIANHHWLNIFDPMRRRQRFWRPGDPASNFFREDA